MLLVLQVDCRTPPVQADPALLRRTVSRVLDKAIEEAGIGGIRVMAFVGGPSSPPVLATITQAATGVAPAIEGCMTDSPQTGDDRVARLEQQLAEATAQVAQVRAELHEVKGTSPHVDLDQVLGPAQAERIRSALTQLGASGQLAQSGMADRLAGLFGPSAGAAPSPAPGTVGRLAEPPRRVPFAFRMAAFSWSWWELFGVIMGITAPIALWGFVPTAIPAGFIAAVATIAFLRGRKNLTRGALLRWGKVATVSDADELSRGTYYSGMTYNNMIVPQATGWDVTRRYYSGPASVTEVRYTLDGVAGVLKLRGLPYAGGVILADSRKPSVALCVSSFPYAVKPDADGELVGHLRARAWVGIVATLLLEGTLVIGAVFSAAQLW